MMMKVTVVRGLLLAALAVGLGLWSTPAAADAAADPSDRTRRRHAG